MKWVDYREILGIGFNDENKLGMCKNRFRNFFPEIEMYYCNEYLKRYANIIGESYKKLEEYGTVPLRCVAADLFISDSLSDLISRYVALIHSCSEKDGEKGLDDILEELLTTTLEQYSIPYEIMHDQDGLFVFPKGAEEFDRELVSNTLIWLSDYPETKKAWRDALKKYAEKNDYSEIADGFRRALERFFQNFFNSGKSLENLKSEYGKFLKDKGVSTGVAGNLETVIQQYTNFMNDHAKHHDSVSANILEYIMYQTGNIIRLLITLEKS